MTNDNDFMQVKEKEHTVNYQATLLQNDTEVHNNGRQVPTEMNYSKIYELTMKETTIESKFYLNFRHFLKTKFNKSKIQINLTAKFLNLILFFNTYCNNTSNYENNEPIDSNNEYNNEINNQSASVTSINIKDQHYLNIFNDTRHYHGSPRDKYPGAYRGRGISIGGRFYYYARHNYSRSNYLRRNHSRLNYQSKYQRFYNGNDPSRRIFSGRILKNRNSHNQKRDFYNNYQRNYKIQSGLDRYINANYKNNNQHQREFSNKSTRIMSEISINSKTICLLYYISYIIFYSIIYTIFYNYFYKIFFTINIFNNQSSYINIISHINNVIFDKNTEEIVFDSGCSSTVITNPNIIQDLIIKKTGRFTLPNGQIIQGSGTGTIKLIIHKYKINIPCVWLPEIKQNLISINDLTAKGYDLQFTKEELQIKRTNESDYQTVLAAINKTTGLYTHKLKNTHKNKKNTSIHDNLSNNNEGAINSEENNEESITTNITDKEWIMGITDRKLPDFGDTRESNNTDNEFFNLHVSTNHFSIRALKNLIKAKGLKIKVNEALMKAVKECKICKLVNHDQISHNKSTQKPPSRRLERIHSDTVGPFYIDKKKYYLTTIIDHYTKYTNIVFKEHKYLQDEVINRLKIWNNKFNNDKIAFYRADNAPEL